MTSKGMLNATAAAVAIAGLCLTQTAVAQDRPAAVPTPAPAEDKAAQDDANKVDGVVLEDIIVTADRASFGAGLVQVGTFRNARLIDVPLTVNVVPQELLKAQAVTGLYEALRNTAGVSRSQTNGSTFDNVAIRGINLENRTSYRLNGSLPIINLVDLPIENKDRVEVLKGVGALYYGYAPPSGIVNLVTKRPTGEVTAFTASINEYAGTRVTADISRRITDDFGVRVNGAAGIIENGLKNFGGERFMASIAMDYDVSPALKLRFDAEHIYKDVTEPATIAVAAVGSILAPPVTAGKRILPPIPDNTLNLGGERLRTAAHATNMMARADLRLSSQFALTVEGGQAITVRDRLAPTIQNYDLRPGLATTGNGQLTVPRTKDQRFRNRNARAELAGAFATGPFVHNLIVGGSINWRYQNGRAATAVLTPQNFFNPIDAFVPAPTVFTLAPLNITDKGAYAVDRVKLGPVELLGGLRYSDYRSRSTSATGVVTDFAVTKTTPSYGVVIKPTKDLSLYGTYLEGLEEVPPAPLNSAFPADVLPPATSQQYEIGFKGEALKGVTFQIAGFRIKRPSAVVDPADNVYKLAGRATYEGVEASVTGEASKEFSVYLSGQYLHARITNAVPVTLIGKVPENTPTWTGSLYAEYRPEALGGLAIGGGAFYVSERAVNNFEEAFVGGYTTFSASLRYRFENVGKGLTAQINADNLTDKRYWAGTSTNVVSTGVPRQIKLTLSLGL